MWFSFFGQSFLIHSVWYNKYQSIHISLWIKPMWKYTYINSGLCQNHVQFRMFVRVSGFHFEGIRFPAYRKISADIDFIIISELVHMVSSAQYIIHINSFRLLVAENAKRGIAQVGRQHCKRFELLPSKKKKIRLYNVCMINICISIVET